ncbi:MAG: hypothetical protein UT61_C0053G0018 [Candidatus Woesebacteria bacterium GW2011_GWA1_39_8]|jgi:hypothetical protein|uniref:Uncharacterized protein n=1 Tax=Candidatus Woesebacteria bacterium GW2011_GWA1_39_8 TaxID=1618552 RepID=A0A0G0SRQ4_9BACT|nr:MAG: hypothetical protein UT61_C0053G0018 [Candidatus Woesebacteria bacterium GW2011_GWA1_39_8]
MTERKIGFVEEAALVGTLVLVAGGVAWAISGGKEGRSSTTTFDVSSGGNGTTTTKVYTSDLNVRGLIDNTVNDLRAKGYDCVEIQSGGTFYSAVDEAWIPGVIEDGPYELVPGQRSRFEPGVNKTVKGMGDKARLVNPGDFACIPQPTDP